MLERPKEGEYNPYYATYIGKVQGDNIHEIFVKNDPIQLSFWKGISSNKWNYKYGPEKWTIKEVLQHIIDTERIFAYRLLRIARGDETALAGFDQDDYAAAVNNDNIDPEALVKEYEAVRLSTRFLVKSLGEKELIRMGNASGSLVSAQALAYMLIGHEIHHVEIVKAKYL